MFAFAHNNFKCINLDRSLKFYQEAWGWKCSAAMKAVITHTVLAGSTELPCTNWSSHLELGRGGYHRIWEMNSAGE